MLVANRHVDYSVVSQRAQRGNDSALLSSTGSGCGDENTGVFAVVGTGLPLSTGVVPECLELGGEVAVSGGNTHEEAIIFYDLIR